MPETEKIDNTLQAKDRCDRCGAQAYVRVTLGGSELLFCNHHYNENETALLPVATSVDDQRERLRDPALA